MYQNNLNLKNVSLAPTKANLLEVRSHLIIVRCSVSSLASLIKNVSTRVTVVPKCLLSPQSISAHVLLSATFFGQSQRSVAVTAHQEINPSFKLRKRHSSQVLESV